ncbi:cytochrome c oxidase accessory protein CcoG [Paracraurococcus lichenis]|uniref:Cytochrome c oxidase accessory protein CcoG n=1 Tax=Paracraurococcus lichenis TaxID=3064888 RepID=A0ABT9E547_9PROT|nr:cytochrome c oxidase accessory protein CcoG [Paracraurococcus sp. LOR1-02]MDO9711289.1 cytochrome c oxidase accessory protein CcoG [Paracraurococcus sp. LOR1-02]
MGEVKSPERTRPEAAPASAAPLYASRQKVYPKAVRGRVRLAKWLILALCLGLYYTVPLIRWDRGPDLPNQAVLVDLSHGRLFFFWFEIWPQEVYYLTGLLMLGAIGLFAATSLFGRVWCGFACPQTVWTDLFMLVERRIQGDRNARMKLDLQPWTGEWLRKKALTHAVWLGIAMATGGAWIMYFDDALDLTPRFFTGRASLENYVFFGLFTATTYLLAGWAREQVCTYMCPWPRFQAAMLDENSLVVTYRAWRGEPRGKAKAQGIGDCVDCRACVHVCPTGIDIRDGQQMECIGCGLCIDACDDVMGRLGRPQGLVAFETLVNLAASEAAAKPVAPGPQRQACGMQARKPLRILRPRTLVYAGVLGLVVAVMAGAWLLRETTSLAVIRDRAPIFVRLADGGTRNAYTLKVGDKTRGIETYSLVLDGPAGLQMTVQDAEYDPAGQPVLFTRPDGITQWRVLVAAPRGLRLPESVPVTFRLVDARGHTEVRTASVFLGPKP